MRRRLAALALGIAGMCLAGCSASEVAGPGGLHHVVVRPVIPSGSTAVINPENGRVVVVVPPHHADTIIVMDVRTGKVRWTFPPTPAG
jgi:hypothetical protein